MSTLSDLPTLFIDHGTLKLHFMQENGMLIDYYKPGQHALKMCAEFEWPGLQDFLRAPHYAG